MDLVLAIYTGFVSAIGKYRADRPQPAACRDSPGSDAATYWIVLSPRSASSATRALNSAVNRRRVVIIVFLRHPVEYTLATCPIFRDHLNYVATFIDGFVRLLPVTVTGKILIQLS